MPALARAAHLSPAHFSREFRRTFGETPHQYLLTRRLERAAALLRTTDRSVADICLTVGLRSVGSFTDVAITLMAVPGPPVFDAETREQIKALVAKGAATGLFFRSDDVRATFEELKSRGVEFQQEPTEQPYGIDAGFRDHEVIIVLEGQATLDDGQAQQVVSAGDIVVIPAGRPHGFVNSGEGRLRQVDIHASAHSVTEWLDAPG